MNKLPVMQPDIYIGALRIAEPVIALTGLGIAVICLYAWWRLRLAPGPVLAQRWMTRFFGLMAISSVLGPVLGHAFYYWAGFPGKYACWVFSIFSLGALAQASIEHARPLLPRAVFPWLTGANLAGVAVAVNAAGLSHSYHWVEAHSALAILGFMLPLEGYVFARRKDPGSRLLLFSVPVAVVALVPVLLKWSPSVWFSYFDVGHVLLYGCFWLMYRGALHLRQVQA